MVRARLHSGIVWGKLVAESDGEEPDRTDPDGPESPDDGEPRRASEDSLRMALGIPLPDYHERSVDQPTVEPTPRPGGSPTLEPGDTLGARYEILAVLGRGGFGAVYKAHDRSLDRTVALKLIHPNLAEDGTALERFKREILLSSRITHKNVVRVYDLGEIDDVKFISMQYIEGRDLSTLLADGRLPFDRVLPLVRQMAEALRAAHEAGVVHRDLKPQNVLLDTDDRVYITDFGISRTLEGGNTMTETGTLVGTLSYMSPEQARGEVPDHRSDIYALGLILYEMLSGEQPFATENPLSSLMRRVHEELPIIEPATVDAPPWLTQLLGRAAARELDDRYASIDELLADLDERTVTRPPRRRPATASRPLRIVAAVALLALASVGAWSLLGSRDPSVPAAAPEVTASIVLAPFENATTREDDAWIRGGLPDLLAKQLGAYPTLRVVDPLRAREAVDDLVLDASRPGDLARLGALYDADYVLTAKFYRSGRRLKLESNLWRAGAAEAIEDRRFTAEGATDDDLFAMIGSLAGNLRGELQLGARRRGGTDLTTDSVEALRAYSEAMEAMRDGADLEAVASLEAALAVDPGFAMARARLAETLDRLGRADEALEQARRASVELQDASAYEAAAIRSIQARLNGDDDAAASALRERVALTPNDPEAHIALALHLEETAALDDALRALRAAAELDPSHPVARYTTGRVLVKLGRESEALDEFDAALAYHVRSENREGEARVLNALGLTHRRIGRVEQALAFFEKALARRTALGDTYGIGVVQSNTANALRTLGRFDAAVEQQIAAIVSFESIGAIEDVAEGYSNLGDIHDAAGRTQLALEAYQSALDRVVEANTRGDVDDSIVARAQSNLGYIYMVLGRYTEAYAMLDSAVTKRKRLADEIDLIRSLLDLGNLDQVQGNFARAENRYQEGLRLARDRQNDAAIGVLTVNLATTLLERGAFATVLARLDEIEAAVRRDDDSVSLVDLLIVRGRLELEIGELEAARIPLEEAWAIAEQTGSASMKARVGSLLGRATPNGDRRILAAAIEAAEASGNVRLQLIADLAGAAAASDVDELDRIVERADALRLAPLAARARVEQAVVALELGRLAEAGRLALDGAERAAELEQADVELRALAIALAAGRDIDLDAALDLVSQVADGLDPERTRSLVGRSELAALVAHAGSRIAAFPDSVAGS